MFQDKIAALCAEAGLPRPKDEADGSLSLHFAGGLSVVLAPRGPDILIQGRVRSLPDEETGRNALCKKLLGLSLGRAGKECLAALPALAVEKTDLVLSLFLPLDSSRNDFEARVESFLNSLETWRKLAESSAPPSRMAFSAMVGGLRP